jgi:hypothetical protein
MNQAFYAHINNKIKIKKKKKRPHHQNYRAKKDKKCGSRGGVPALQA